MPCVLTCGSAGSEQRLCDSSKANSSVIARPPPLDQASPCDGEQSRPRHGRQAPRLAAAARRWHRSRQPRPKARRPVPARCAIGWVRVESGPAAATPPPITTRLTPRVKASDRMARARWPATRSVISAATSSPAEPARNTSAALGFCDSTVWRPAAMASLACRPMAGPAATVSRQPRRPHAQTDPSGSATT